MKVVIYDPLYSKIGHFERYNSFISEMLSELKQIERIICIGEDPRLESVASISPKIQFLKLESKRSNKQIESLKKKGFAKLTYAIDVFREYRSVINLINRQNPDLTFFLSQGQLPFWMASKSLKSKYWVSAISVRWLYSKNRLESLVKKQFVKYLTSANRSFYTEDQYKKEAEENGIENGIVAPDRYLKPFPKQFYRGEETVLSTVGTISKTKNPIELLAGFASMPESRLKHIKYNIIGKILDGTKAELTIKASVLGFVHIEDDYISTTRFIEILDSTTFAAIPYSMEYTKYVTSGVMWDCFERKVPILCPENPIFDYYIKKYKVGYTYYSDDLGKCFDTIDLEKVQFDREIGQNYDALLEAFSKPNVLKVFDNALTEISKQ